MAIPFPQIKSPNFMSTPTFKSFLLFAVTSLLISSCYVSKPMDHDVRISINTDFSVVIKNLSTSNFSSKHSDVEYRKAYMDELTKELLINHVTIDNASPEFVVKVIELEITESTKPDTVKDVKSKDNGMVRQLTQAGLKTHGTVMQSSTTTIKNWEADKDKNESLTSNRSLDQIISGDNKDNSSYREKEIGRAHV